MARNKADGSPDAPRFTTKRAKNAVAVAGILAPAVAPFALSAATQLRNRYDHYRARQLGVDVEEIAKYTGRGAALQARIAGDQHGCTELTEQPGRSEADVQFARTSTERLQGLLAAVRAAERMPNARRRAAFKAVDADLEILEKELLKRLGVSELIPKT